MSIVNKIKKYCIDTRWTLGFIEEPLEDIIEGKPINVHYIRHSFKDRWFADPFILDVDENFIYVLVEEYYDPLSRGRIAKLLIERQSYKLVKTEPILELSSHLSFPAILREDNKVYIYPENALGEGLSLYEYDANTNKCIYVENITNKPLADAVITDIFGDRLMFSTHMPTHNGNILSVDYINNGKPVTYTECVFSEKIARNAGDWFKLREKTYRPAQDCKEVYGGAVILQEVQKNGHSFKFNNIRRLTTNHPKYSTGLHTFNHFKGVTVIDVHGWRHLFASKLFHIFIKLKQLFVLK